MVMYILYLNIAMTEILMMAMVVALHACGKTIVSVETA